MKIEFESSEEQKRWMRNACYLGIQVDRGAKAARNIAFLAATHVAAAWSAGNELLSMLPEGSGKRAARRHPQRRRRRQNGPLMHYVPVRHAAGNRV